MIRKPRNPPLRVLLNGVHVGTLTRAVSGAIDFKYAPDWLGRADALPVSLSLPLREDRYIGRPVMAVFDNLLPDDPRIRNRLAARVHAGGADAYSLLSCIGHDCVGALQFIAGDEEAAPIGTIEGEPIDDAEIAAKLSNLAEAPLGLGDDEGFRISIAGAQEKTALLLRDGKWLTPVGTTATTHILKPQIGRLPNGIDLSNSVENEYLCLKLCAALGLATARAEIVDFAGVKALAVERFDRRWTRDGRLLRLPQEDMCQALSVAPNDKHQTDGGPDNQMVTGLLKGSDDPTADQLAYLKAQIVFWLLGATDGHAKNFSIFLRPGGRFRLTPLYDVLTSQPSVDEGQVDVKKFRLAMSVGDSNHYRIDQIQPRHFLQTTARCGFDQMLVRSQLEDLLAHAETRMEPVFGALPKGFPQELADSTLNGIRQRLRIVAAWHATESGRSK